MLVWMDLEMTGLEDDRHVIVEIATLITDDDLNIVAEGPDLVIHASEEELAEMGELVTTMHTSSGLLEQIKASSISLERAEAETLAFIQSHVKPGSTPLAGNSISTDRRFLARYMPSIENYLHYRIVDVSSIKELCRRWYPKLASKAPGKDGSHRAMDDIRDSVAELIYYRQQIFIDPPEAKA
ncbi:MAG: oligoribonuclease [Actinomycetota bacterium]